MRSTIFLRTSIRFWVLEASGVAPGAFEQKLAGLKAEAHELDRALTGDKSRVGWRLRCPSDHELVVRPRRCREFDLRTDTGPRVSLTNAQEALAPVATAINRMMNDDLPRLRRELMAEGAPWGRVRPYR